MSFASDIARISDKLDTVLESVFKEVTLSVRDRVAAKTPIVTGRASGSWNASVHEPDHESKPVDYLNPIGAPMDGKRDVDAFKLGDQLYIANGLEYIGRLNAGSSLMAPAGFVETAVVETQLDMGNITRKVKREVGI